MHLERTKEKEGIFKGDRSSVREKYHGSHLTRRGEGISRKKKT